MTDIDSLIQLAKERITKLSTKILNAKSNDESYGFMAKQEIHYFWLSKLKELKSEIEDAPLLDGWVRVEDAKKMIVEFGDILLGDYEMSTCVDETGENVVCWILCGTEQKSDSNKLLESLIKEKYFPKLKELKQSLPSQDSEMLDWMQSMMTDDNDYCEIFFAGLRNWTGKANAFQIESNPEKFKVSNAPSIREVILIAMNETKK